MGVKRTVTIGAWIGAVACIGRIFSVNFAMAWSTMFLLGTSIGLIVPNLPKMVWEWFPPEETGIASGVYISSVGIGISLGLMTGAFFPSWQSVSIQGGGDGFNGYVVGSVSERSPHSRYPTIRESPMKESVLHSIKKRNVWLLAFAQFLFLGGFIAYTGGSPMHSTRYST